MDIHPILSLYTEKDWNNHSPDEIKKLGDEASVVHMYMASKSLAERAAWDCYNSLKGSIGWDLVTILPGIVFGVTTSFSDARDENLGLTFLLANVTGDQPAL